MYSNLQSQWSRQTYHATIHTSSRTALPAMFCRVREPTHNWTAFEKRILLCLIAREVHIVGDSGPTAFVRKVTAKEASQSFYKTGAVHKDFPDAFNRALNGENLSGEAKDIDGWEVINMALIMMAERRAAMSMLARRQDAPRLTRSKKRVWERALNFAGDYSEWIDEERINAVTEEARLRADGKVRLITRDARNQWIVQGPKPVMAQRAAKACGGAWDEHVQQIDQTKDTTCPGEDMDIWGDNDETMVDLESTNSAVTPATVATTQGAEGEGLASVEMMRERVDPFALGVLTSAAPVTTADIWKGAAETPEPAIPSISEKEKLVEGATGEASEMDLANDWGNLDSTFNGAFPDQHWEEDATMVETFPNEVDYFEHETTLSNSRH